MRLVNLLLGPVVLVVLAGCSMRVTSDYDRSADFSRLETYSWATPDQPATGDPALDDSLLHSRVRRAVERELSVKGYRVVASGEPDFLVTHHVTRETKFAPTFASPGWQSGLRTELDQYREGTLILDLLDPNDMRLLWRGTAITSIDESAAPKDREATVNKAVRLILERFPPKPK